MITLPLEHSPLGKANTYVTQYDASLLFPIERNATRAKLGIDLVNLPFQGTDMWTAFELSWLNTRGKPLCAIATFSFPCTSPRLIESKSFKLYLNSFNNTQFASAAAVADTLVRDLSQATGAIVQVQISPVTDLPAKLVQFDGVCIDELDVACDTYTITPDYLKVEDKTVSETLVSNLLKSNCPVTGQPDWASLMIRYQGRQINHAGLLQYIVSYRNHDGFHEDCVERIFTDINKLCCPEALLVYARYTRRGGLDINPYRASYPLKLKNERLLRQ
jgi:7-cyano-7-deazaguanine reductase